MFSNEYAKYVDALSDVVEQAVVGGEAVDNQARVAITYLNSNVVPNLAPATGSLVYATKDEVIAGAGGGMLESVADLRYAPITGSLVYATKAEVPDVSGKANSTDVTTALAGKSDLAHTHTGVYQPVGSYLVAADIAGKADTTTVTSELALKADASAVTTALAGKSDLAHTHTGLPSAILTTSAPTGASDTNVYSALESDARFASVAGAGITQNQADARYLKLTDAASTYETQSAATTALAGKSDTNHTHTGVYQPAGSYAPATNPANGQNNYAGKDYVDAQIATRQVAGTYLTTDDDSAYETKANASSTYFAIANLANSGAGSGSSTKAYTTLYADQLLGNKAGISNSGSDSASLLKAWCCSYVNTNFAPATGSANYAPATGSTVYETQSAATTALAGKSNTDHTHTGVYQPVGSYLVAADIAGKADSATVTSELALKADASAVTTALAGKSDTNHTHTGVYQPAGSYAPATNPANGQNNYAGKDYVDAQIATRQVAGTYLTSDDDSAYQTKANMVTVGSETTYYSKDKVDALLSGLGSGGSLKILEATRTMTNWGGTWNHTHEWTGSSGTYSNSGTDLTIYPNPPQTAASDWGAFSLPSGKPDTWFTVIACIRYNAQSAANDYIRGVAISTVTNPAYYPLSDANYYYAEPDRAGLPSDVGQRVWAQSVGETASFPTGSFPGYYQVTALIKLSAGQYFRVWNGGHQQTIKVWVTVLQH